MQSHGVDIYNLTDTGETAVSITTYTGHSTGSGPKVAISKSRISSAKYNLCGTLCSLMYRKNCNQDNLFYIIETQRKTKMEENKEAPIDTLKKILGDGKVVITVVELSEMLLRIVASGMMTLEQAIVSLGEIRKSLKSSNGSYNSMADAIKDINNDSPHQQDQLNCQDEAARTLAASTHGAASHLTKTVVEGEDEQGEEICIVRRLTPTETSRLQGFPDDYTKIDGGETSDAPQYKAHGNSWATPCANYISSRMEMELRRLGHEGTIRYATCCSGIEAHSVAVRGLDWKAMFFSEIEPFPCRVLASHYPDVPNLGDMTQIRYDAAREIITNEPEEGYSLPKEFLRAPIQFLPFKKGGLEVFSGGVPCTDVSVAGKRAGMAEGSGTRSSLAFTYQRIIEEIQPQFTIYENVPGVFSSNGGADFVWFVSKMASSGYAMAWRVLDAQYTTTEEFPRAVPQRRRRVWMVGYRGNDWRIPARIVFETNKALGDNPPNRIPGLGFKTLNPNLSEEDINSLRKEAKDSGNQNTTEDLFSMFAETSGSEPTALKVSQMIPLDDFPDEGDFSKVPLVNIYELAKTIGEPGYLGDVFRKDKKTAYHCLSPEELEYLHTSEVPSAELAELKEKLEKLQAQQKAGELHWEGAEKINPDILENIGNAGILANGRVLTMNCHEWTGGIQLSPKTYSAWEEVMRHKDWLKANALLPEAYDETVCGLSDVLVENPDEKYNLSWRACFGILRRAETRGKELPEPLYIALVSTIRENAGIVKWVAINGKETKKKETDLTEREIAKLCFDRFISPVVKFDDVEAVQPKRKSDDSDEDDTLEETDDEVEVDDEGNPIEDEGFGEVPYGKTEVPKDEIPNFPNGCMNEEGGETSPTIVASQYKGPGNTQDGTVVAVKKEKGIGEDTTA